ncbi:trichohyalin-like [Engraulis encrasicolus]|uniref:trichohyalin-like n=1 Tax=Engraulis encrasicolus TaxID=184585 RepID=UPI002FD1205A
MDRFPPALLEELRPSVQRDIRLILEAVEEEYIRQNAAWKNTVRHGDEQNRRLTAALEAAEAARLQERERLQASIRQLNQQLQEVKRQASLIRADQASQTATGQAMISTMGRHLQELQDQMEKEKRQALERQNEMVMEIEKMREQIKRERERRVGLLFLQRRRVMDELQQQAARWMQREELESHVREQLMKEEQSEAKWEIKRQRLEASIQKNQEKLKAAARRKQEKLAVCKLFLHQLLQSACVRANRLVHFCLGLPRLPCSDSYCCYPYGAIPGLQLKHQPGLLLSVCEAQRLQKKLKRIPAEESCVGEAAGEA